MKTINLLPMQQYPARLILKQSQRFFYKGLLSVLISVIILYAFYAMQLQEIEKKILRFAQIQRNQAQQAAQVDAVIDKIKYYQEKLKQLELSSDDNMCLMNLLTALPHIMPKDVYLINFSWQAYSGIIYGQAMDAHQVVEFLQALKKTDHFEKFELVKSDKRHENNHTPLIYFVIKFYD